MEVEREFVKKPLSHAICLDMFYCFIIGLGLSTLSLLLPSFHTLLR